MAGIDTIVRRHTGGPRGRDGPRTTSTAHGGPVRGSSGRAGSMVRRRREHRLEPRGRTAGWRVAASILLQRARSVEIVRRSPLPRGPLGVVLPYLAVLMRRGGVLSRVGLVLTRRQAAAIQTANTDVLGPSRAVHPPHGEQGWPEQRYGPGRGARIRAGQAKGSPPGRWRSVRCHRPPGRGAVPTRPRLFHLCAAQGRSQGPWHPLQLL